MLAYLWSSRGTLQAVVVLVLFVLALSRGAGPERWCSAVLLASLLLVRIEAAIASGFSTIWGLDAFERSDLGYLAIDLITFVALLVVALRANRIYPLWMAGVQLTALLTHFADQVTEVVPPLAYAVLNLSTFYLAIVFLGVGMIAHTRRRKILGPYPSWRTDLSLSRELMR